MRVGFAISGYKSWGMTVSKTFGSKEFSVAGLAMDFLIGAIASQHRVQWTMAFGAVEAFFMPHLYKKKKTIKFTSLKI